MTPADELRTAAAKMRGFPGTAAEPIAKLLESIADLHGPAMCEKHEGCAPLGCQWCADEDWPCADTRNALTVAHAINGGEQQ